MNDSIIILQARSNSRRLPFKSLSQIGGLPLFLLCAKRLMNKGHDLIVATTVKKDDDFIVQICKKNKIKYFRGSSNNVKSRFKECIKKFPKKKYVIRATADNPTNDGLIVSYILDQIKKEKLKYLYMPNKLTGFPIGIGLECFEKKFFLNFLLNSNHTKDIEHVSLSLRQNNKVSFRYFSKIKINKINSSLTIDKISDYLRVSKIFDNVDDPINISYKKIIEKNKKLHFKLNKLSKKSSKLILGGAQIGMNYGFKNEKMIANRELKKIFNLMKTKKINSIDTAQSYEKSEEQIGSNFNILGDKNLFIFNKFFEIKNISKYKNNFIKKEIFLSVYLSMKKLNINNINVMMIHSVDNFLKKEKLFYKTLLSLKKLKLINDFGISVYTPAEFIDIYKKNFFKYIQIPYNIIDNRWKNKAIINLKKKKIKIIARSVFLRGYLINQNKWPRWFKERKNLNRKIDIIVNTLKLKNTLELCFRYVNSINFIDYIIVGCNNSKQFKEILNLTNKSKFSKKNLNLIYNTIKVKDQNIIDGRNF